ncbi:MAG: hypothetical protein DWQ05_06780 [Calditrichaeota bacterium]|nr:MAG: hypothetical protein DWQ05_06780 [Calditrichota bacterium]
MSNKFMKNGLIVALLLIVTGFLLQDRISGTFAVYSHLSKILPVLNSGQDNLSFNASIVQKNESKIENVLDFAVRYQKDKLFAGDIQFNTKHFQIRADAQQTSVLRSQPALRIQGEGVDFKNFDIAKFFGDVLNEHPKMKEILQLSWGKKTAVTLWCFFNCSFDNEDIDSMPFNVITFPESKSGKNRLSVYYQAQKQYRVIYDETAQIDLIFTDPEEAFSHQNTIEGETIIVERAELNKSIYQGALRAAGILLENQMPISLTAGTTKWGTGQLIIRDNKRILLANGSHREIGEAHGALLKPEVKKLVYATLYTMGWIYTLEKGEWFVDAMRGAYARLQPFIPQKYQNELAGLSKTSGVSLQELQLANVFPALFHCSGYALFNGATKDGVLYHGRILDYITELGLQNMAVVSVFKPDGSYGFANIGYAGFIGSVSGMNENQVAFGEMGGRGVGDWDGMPMPILMREGLETTSTLSQAVALFRDTPRTCEYYYVITDGKIPDAVGLSTTPTRFITIKPNQFHPQLQHPMEDAVLMSAGDRYEKLAGRVKNQYGQIDQEKAIRLMDRPVAMKSDLHNVLFAPQSLDFWVADAGINTPACNEPYVHFSLADLLQEFAAKSSSKSDASE